MQRTTTSSLSGQNTTNNGVSGARSSRASSTILFKRLRKLDREISKLKFLILIYCYKSADKLKDRLSKLDEKRRVVREERKRLGIKNVDN